MAHLSHKIPWHLLVDYFTPYHSSAIELPVGVCDKIHVNSKKVQIQVLNRNYIEEDDICRDDSCVTKSEKKIFVKKMKKSKIFGSGFRNCQKLEQFFRKFAEVIMEFVNTELNTPREDIKYVSEFDENSNALNWCERCNKFITLLEFGDKNELFKYSDEELKAVIYCTHGVAHATDDNLEFLIFRILPFYLYMNVILYCNLKEENWPAFMKPDSRFRRELRNPIMSDLQSFLPHSRKYLQEAMIDFDKSRMLSKNLFRFIYFYVMMRMKIEKNYSFLEHVEDYQKYYCWGGVQECYFKIK